MATLKELKKWCKEEGIKETEDLHFYTGPNERIYLASVYRGDDGHPCIDLEYGEGDE